MEYKDDTQIPLSHNDEMVLETKKPTHNKTLLVMICIVLVAFLLGYAIVSNRDTISSSTLSPNPSIASTTKPTKQTQNDVFIRGIPNFGNKNMMELPNMTDTRGIYTYGDNYIVASIHRIIEFDPIQKQIVRMNNPDVLGCVHNTAKVDKYLFVTCNHTDSKGNDLGNSKMAKIDLETGEIVKVYFANDSLKRVNLWVTALGSTVWGSSWDGIFVLDTPTDTMKTLAMADIGYPGCRAHRIYTKNNKIIVLITDGSDCPGGGTAEYDEQKNTWIRGPYTNESVEETNQVPVVEGYKMPKYLALSDLIDDIYILVSDIGLFTLQKNEFPKQEIVFPKPILMNGPVEVYIEPTARFVVVLGVYQMMGKPTTLSSALMIMVIDRTTKQVSYLTNQYTQPLTDRQYTVWTLFQKKIKFVPTDSGVVVTQDDTSIATIHFSPATIIFQNK